MSPGSGDIEKDTERQRLVLSMRTKVFLLGSCFLLVLGLTACTEMPHYVDAVQHMVGGASLAENESHPSEMNQPPGSLEQEAPEPVEEESPREQAEKEGSPELGQDEPLIENENQPPEQDAPLQQSTPLEEGELLPSSAPCTNHTVWKYVTAGVVRTSPAVADGMVFIGSGDGSIYALDQLTGGLVWSSKTGGWVFSSPAVANGMVFAGSEDGKIYALDQYTGKRIWSYQTGYYVQSSPAVANGMVFVGSCDGKIYALDQYTGELVWSHATPVKSSVFGPISWVFSDPAVADGMVFTGWGLEGGCNVEARSRGFYALDQYTGDLIWSYDDGGSVQSAPAIVDSMVFAGFYDGKVRAFDERTGKLIWSHQTNGSVESSPAVVNGMVFVSSDGSYALDQKTGEPIWETNVTGGHTESSPVLAGGVVFVGSGDGKIYTLDQNTGDLVWSFQTGGPVESSPAVAGGMVFIGSEDHVVYAFGPAGNTSQPLETYSAEVHESSFLGMILLSLILQRIND